MCGINGILAYHYAANPIDAGELLRTRDHMAARGPDAEGEWISDDRRIGFGHRRLAIIDLTDSGAQPMVSITGQTIITFNGEIYNYQALRKILEQSGRQFRSQSDTEVLLHLYEMKGPEMVHDLRGMFAFAIWDFAKRGLFLARDPYGIKPLYYADDGWTLRFASQVKALLAGGALSREPDPAGRVGVYLFGSVPEPFTMYRYVRALPAGSSLWVDAVGAQAPRKYHSIAQVYCDAERNPQAKLERTVESARAEFREALLDSVRHHLIADVPVGAFLSSGIDSSALLGLMRDAGQQNIETVTLTFQEFEGKAEDEAPLAAEVARTYGARHTTRVVSESEFLADLPHIWEAMDQPSIDGVNSWFVSKAAAELGLKVAISGVGGDELFGGYPSFTDIPRWVHWSAMMSWIPWLGRWARIAGQPIAAALGANPKAAGMFEYGGGYAGAYLLRRGLFMPWELPEFIEPDILEQGLRRLAPLALIKTELSPRPDAPAARVSALESSLYMKNQLLRDTDWASMAHSIEVRTPLVDATLLQKAAAIVAATGVAPNKSLLAEAPARPLPAEVKSRPKTGFTTPLAVWQERRTLASARQSVRPIPSSTGPWARTWAQIVMAEQERAIA